MHICILHQALTAHSGADERDVLDQVAFVADTAVRLGHRVDVRDCGLDLAALDAAVAALRPDVVFNLVESLDGAGRFQPWVPSLLEQRGIAYTGAPADALFLATHKTLAKHRLAAAGLPTPAWIESGMEGTAGAGGTGTGSWLLKSTWEHASAGVHASNLLTDVTAAEARRRLEAMPPSGGGWYAEVFVDGREFNVSLLDGPTGPIALPAAEIVFDAFPPGQPRILDYAAKWQTDSFAYANTPRRFVGPGPDEALAAELQRLSLACWRAFGLAGYSRVDFRVDAQGRPWILEVNANPCLSPDAGFAAALTEAGLTAGEAVAAILESGRRRHPAGRKTNHEPAAAQPAPALGALGEAVRIDGGRREVRADDVAAVAELVRATRFFHEPEVDVAVELVQERLAKGPAAGYEFVLVEQAGRLVGYTCFGRTPCTESSYDLYWIVVHPNQQGRGLGRRLMEESERIIAAMGGTRVYVETSNRPQYLSTRAFYDRCGYRLASVLDDFYGPGDGKATYVKVVG